MKYFSLLENVGFINDSSREIAWDLYLAEAMAVKTSVTNLFLAYALKIHVPKALVVTKLMTSICA